MIYIHDLESPDTLRYEGPGTFLPGDPRTAALLGLPTQHGGFATQTSWGYKVLLRASYNNVLAGYINGLTLEPTLRFDDDVYGVTPTPLQNFTEASRLISPSLGFRYLNNTTAEVGYTAYIGGGQGNLVRDRDFYSFNVKYTFLSSFSDDQAPGAHGTGGFFVAASTPSARLVSNCGKPSQGSNHAALEPT